MTPFIVLFFFLQVGKTENNALDSIVDQLDDVAVEGLLMLYLHALTFSGNMQARVYCNVYWKIRAWVRQQHVAIEPLALSESSGLLISII